MKRMFWLVIVGMGLFSCGERTSKPHYPFTPRFPDSPVNLAEFNTPYDDYNSISPTAGETAPLCFSSNRNSSGENFDVIYKLLEIDFSRANGSLRFQGRCAKLSW